MPSIASGQVEEVYCPVSGSLSVTPGSGGRVSVNSRNRKGGQAIAPREVYSAETFSVSAGDVVLLEAIGAAASYSSVPGDGIPLASAALATTTGEAGQMYRLTDGPDAGAPLTWATPSGATSPTWCWWAWPQSAYEG